MPQYVLRVEGVNHANVIDDTDDLSTRRGGGLMLLYAVRQLAPSFPELTPQATGASVGLFTLDAADDGAAEAVAERVRRHFHDDDLEYPLNDAATRTGHLPLRHGTFVVDVVRADGSAVERATAANRWRQWQEPTVSLAGVWDAAAGECWQNCVRPAVRGRQLRKDRQHDVCESVYRRHEYGREQRQRFYPEVIGVDADFTDTFEGISDRTGLAPHPTHNKLAVFYADGNKFGAIGREKLAAGMGEYKEWSDALQNHHKKLLAGLVTHAKDDPAWLNGGAIRLETLLWGGDELLWVVPGWKGWELVERFFGQPHTVQERPLTYAAGLVFCGTRTPIHNVVTLAHRLADEAKKAREGHSLAYEVLESFDDITGDWDAHRRRWLPPSTKASTDPLTINPAQDSAFWTALRAVAAAPDFPMRQLYLLAHAWRTGEPTEPHRKRLTASGVGAALETVLAGFGDPEVGWLHLLQMLPYVPVREGAE
ncbi:MAG TPA: hypothetical protein VD866_03160 [Urbifossiella sp.]|nr:hypothetical protein [Urbifossiella sp.]